MKRLNKLYFLVHGFCYAGLTGGEGAAFDEARERLKRYVHREETCAEQWRARLEGFSSSDGLVIIPWPGDCNSATLAYQGLASSVLGDRVFVLDCPDCFAPAFWSNGDAEFREAVFAELKAAFVGQRLRCNQEELFTDLHCLACCRRLEDMFQERGYRLDKATVHAEGWGASFEGCVTKYTVTIRRLLGVAKEIEIRYGLTVPDTSFLVDVKDSECVLLANGLRLFIFQNGHELIALYTRTSHSLADGAAFVRLPAGLHAATVRTKQGIRLWPQPEPYELSTAPIECREPAQELVTVREGRLSVPVSAGFVYRLAKAPAYIFAPAGLSYGRFRELLTAAEQVEA